MRIPQSEVWSARRRFIESSSAIIGSLLLGYRSSTFAAPAPEVRKIRIVIGPATCFAPLLVAEELLRMEGFSEIEYVNATTEPGPMLIARDAADFAQWDVAAAIPLVDAGKPLLFLAGLHAGCQELVVSEKVRAIRELKGKRVAVSALGNADHINLSSMLAYVGIDPRKDVSWVIGSDMMDSMNVFMSGNADAFLGFAPQPQEVQKQRKGHTIINTLTDKPWSQYFCCTLIGNSNFVKKYPTATKRATKAILKAADLCAADPAKISRFLVQKGFEKSYETAHDVLKVLPFRQWRDFSLAATIQFHALKLREVGMISNSPLTIISRGTEFRFLDEIREELKA